MTFSCPRRPRQESGEAHFSPWGRAFVTNPASEFQRGVRTLVVERTLRSVWNLAGAFAWGSGCCSMNLAPWLFG